MEKLDGVEKAEISLEKGSAKISLKPDNQVTLSEIQKIVKRNGFSPEGAQLKLNGTIEKEKLIITHSNETFPLVLKNIQMPPEETEHQMTAELKIEEDRQIITITSIEK
jgi:hypothetical protein